MKILTVVLNLEKGGTQRAAQNFCEAYAALGHDSRIIGLYGGGPRVREMREQNLTVWVALPDSLPLIVQWNPDVVHLHSHGLKFEDLESLRQSLPHAKLIETNVFSKPTSIEKHLSVSFQLSKWCLFLYHYRRGDRSKSVVVPNPVKCDTLFRPDADAIRAFKERHEIPADAFVVGRIGQALPRKWSDSLETLFERFTLEECPKAHLLLCNAPHGLVESLRANPNLRGKVTVIDSIIGDAELRLFYGSLDLMLHIADVGESFGMVIAESLLCETPVLTLNTPWGDNAQAEVIGDDIGGRAANNLSELYRQLVSFYRDAPRRREAGKRGREFVISQFEMLSVARKALAALQAPASDRFQRQSIAKYTHDDWLSRALILFMYLTRSDRVGILAGKVFMRRSGLPKTTTDAIPQML